MNYSWGFVIDIGLLSGLLLIATTIKRKVKFFQKYLVPNAIIAGLLGLILVNAIPNFNFLKSENMAELIYHLLNISFIALSFKHTRKAKSSEISATGAFIIAGYVIQAILGFGLSLLMVNTIFPDLFPGFGLLLPLGFGQGPGQATAIGASWESAGFVNGGIAGMTLAAIGILWACFAGVPLLNWLMRQKKKRLSAVSESETERAPQNDLNGAAQALEDIYEDEHSTIPLSDSIDRLSFQIAIIGAVYFVTYLILKGLSALLIGIGQETVVDLLWGLAFIPGSAVAIFARLFINGLVKVKFMKKNYIDNYLLQRISGLTFDFMLVACIAGISLAALDQYLWPMLIVTTLGGIVTLAFSIIVGRYVYRTSPEENIVGIYGNLAGTMQSGMGLIRELDPTFKTSAANNQIFGSGVAMVLGTPLMFILGIATEGFQTGDTVKSYVTMGVFVAYFAVLIFLIWLFSRKNRQIKK